MAPGEASNPALAVTVHLPRPAVPAASTPSEAIDVAAMPRILGRILKLAAAHPVRLGLMLVTSAGATAFGVAMPRLLGRAVDRAHGLLAAGAAQAGQANEALAISAALLIGAALVRGLLQMVSGYLGEWVAQAVVLKLRLAFFDKLQRLDFAFHDRTHSGDLITRGMLDLDGMRGFIENGLQRLVGLVMLVGFGSVLLITTDPVMAGLALSFVPFVAWRAARTGLHLRLTWTRLQERMSILTRTMEENLQGVRVVRAFSAKEFELVRFDAAAKDALRLANHRILVRSAFIAGMGGAFHLAMAAVLWAGGHRVQAGAMTVGQLTEILGFMMLLQLPVRQVNMIVNSSARATSSGARLFEILDRPPKVADRPDAIDLSGARGVLRFSGVGFSYGDAKPVLSDISFEVAPGRTLGIVGAAGSGKSTLAHLVPRFYDPSRGAITIDGVDIRDASLDSLRRLVCLVSQDVFLFDDTAAANICYADPDADEERWLEASNAAQIHDHFAALPEAYSSRIGERGVGLSGGQRQRLSIARGIVPDPTILVFDDATSAVDAATEHRVRAALKDATRHKAVLIISHRLGSVMHADEIIVLDQGRIIERGRHDQLLAQGGHYAEIYRLQFGAGPETDA
jgi:ATP-binding cassette subfamily B protein